MTDPTPLRTADEPDAVESAQLLAELVQFEPSPGPAGRVQRTAGQVGAVLVLLELWLAFGWFGSEDWTERQLLAVTAVATLLASVLQNVANHFRRNA